jgi:hypothetical protein
VSGEATRWGVRAVDSGLVRVHINGLLFDFDPREAADLAQTIRVILGIEKPTPAGRLDGDAPSDSFWFEERP